ncbi:MAG: transcription antitermination factor NusB [Actinomycetota bacterium]|nr:transcription antitermination factor NusB [Actinomycetota bacterium]
MPTGETKRTKERKYALRILFEMDISEASLEEVLRGKSLAGERKPSDFTLMVVNIVLGNKPWLDRLISSYSKGWEIERMPAVDRNILRMAIAEIIFIDDIPSGVTIDEAVELAKLFSTEDSGRFINGILGQISRDGDAKKICLPKELDSDKLLDDL